MDWHLHKPASGCLEIYSYRSKCWTVHNIRIIWAIVSIYQTRCAQGLKSLDSNVTCRTHIVSLSFALCHTHIHRNWTTACHLPLQTQAYTTKIKISNFFSKQRFRILNCSTTAQAFRLKRQLRVNLTWDFSSSLCALDQVMIELMHHLTTGINGVGYCNSHQTL